MTPETAARLRLPDDGESMDFAAGPQLRRRVVPPSPPVRQVQLESLDLDGQAAALAISSDALRRRLLGVADVAAATLALIFVLTAFGQRGSTLALLVGVPFLLFVCKSAGLYDRDARRLAHSTLDEVPALAQLTGLFTLVVAMLHTSVTGSGSLRSAEIAALWISSFGAVLLGRTLARGFAGRTAPLERCLVIGDARRAAQIREKLDSCGVRARVIATLPLEEDTDVLREGDTLETIRSWVDDLGVQRIIIAPASTESDEVVELIRIAKTVGTQVSVLPRMFEAVGPGVEFDVVGGMTMLAIRRFGLPRSSRAIKRAFDLMFTSLGLVVISPIILALALAIRLDSRGPVFFRQLRVGRDGEHFRIFKFRSMVADAELLKETLRSLNEAGDGLFKIVQDPRVTRVGRFLRRTSLDELPQLLNVLRGEMSLVGPRPLVTDEDARVLGLDRSRLHLTPGMTGPWQVLPARVPMQEMVGIDYLYVANWSLWADLKILLLTVRHVARRGNV